MKRRAGPGGGGHGAAGGASSRRGDRDGEGRGGREGNDGRDGEGKLRIHLKRSCTDRKVVQGETELGLTTDDWQKFKRLLASKTFTSHETKRISGADLTAAWAEESGFREPVIAPDKTGLGLQVPDSACTVADVARVVGEDKAIRPIHVGEQANIDQSMTLAEFAEYFETCTKPGQAILNMISLEFSDTPLAKMVQSPQLVRDIDWLNRCWPEDRKQEGQFPKVQYYCLMSQAGSYTDFHVDFGGTSVWYHILKGEKEFLLIRPTKKNLDLYESWIRSPTQSQVFFGDLADTCYRLVLNAGETLMIPSGWIHAVFTPKPSLVFGGNFLHSLNIPMQLQVHEIEGRAKIHNKFRFPFFKEMMLFAASKFLNSLRAEQGEAPGQEEKRAAENGEACGAEGGVSAAAAAAPNSGAATRSNGERNGAGSGAGVPLGPWERQGLRPLLEACQSWVKAEEEDSDEDDVPEEWHLAATMAGCADVNEMLAELGHRVSAMEEAAAAAVPSKEANSPTTDGSGGLGGNGANSCTPMADPIATDHNRAKVVEAREAAQHAAHASPETGGAAALLLAAAAASTLEGRDTAGSTETTVVALPTTKSGLLAAALDHAQAAESADSGAGGRGEAGADGSGGHADGSASHASPGKRRPSWAAAGPSGTSSASSYSIPKLKLSIKPQQRQPPSPRVSSSTGGAVGGANGGGAAVVGNGGSPRAGLKLVLKGPALSSPRGGAGGGGGESSAGKKRGRQQQQQQQQQRRRQRPQERRWKEDCEDSDEFEAIRNGDDEEDDDGDNEEEEEEEEEEEDSGDDTRVGRGGKRKARPLGSRLRAIARLGDDAAGGDSEDDDSADEYKPGLDDDVLPGDHKIYADELPRELKKGKSSSVGGSGGGGRQGSAWKGFGSGGSGSARGSSGGTGGKVGGPVDRVGGIAGMRRLSVTKQEALRSKGVFKIAPQSKVPVKPNGKDKKPLTAKQKLMAKMRR